MTTLNKLLEYYQHWSRINKAYNEILDKLWTLHPYMHMTSQPPARSSLNPYYITRERMIERLNHIHKDDILHEALPPNAQRAIKYCLSNMQMDINVYSIYIDSRDNIPSVIKKIGTLLHYFSPFNP